MAQAGRQFRIWRNADAAASAAVAGIGPIEALGWTAMTMEFDVLPGVNLEAIIIGQSIHFSLVQSEVGDYVINIIHQPEPAGTDESIADEPGEDAS